ncbi:MAG: TolC family protein [Saprospiraceae bacterium]|nr:TolC family protein [Saprospiraceae bacterium]
MTKNKLFIALIFCSVGLFAQKPDTITLDYCHNLAIKNYPVSKQKELFIQKNALAVKNLKKNYLPQLSVNAQATYQSDVTAIELDFSEMKVDIQIPGLPIPIPELPIEITGPDMPEVAKDQYKMSLDVNQVIYDGGVTNNQRKIEDIDLQINNQSVDVELFSIKQNINDVFFTLFLLQENKKLIEVSKEEINSQLKKIQSGIDNGVILKSNSYAIEAEIIKLEQKQIEAENGILTAFKILNEYCGTEFSENSLIMLPEQQITANSLNNNRPELTLFDFQKQKITASKKLISTKTRPKMYGFGQVGYGNPGLNMFSEGFNSYYIVGARISWNIWDWNQSKTDKKILDIQNKIIDSKKETFEKNIKIAGENSISAISNYELLIQKDNEIIELRTKIKETAASQLANGVITSSEYISELNAETQAKLNLQYHKIQLTKAKINYLTITGNM